jgi:hypothetical protein
MRLFKKGRGQRDVFSYFFGVTGLDWKSRDVLVTADGFLCWLTPEAHLEKLSDEEVKKRAKEVISLKNCNLGDLQHSPSIPEDVANVLKVNKNGGDQTLKFFTFELIEIGKDSPIQFGFIDKAMIENLYDQIQNAIERSHNKKRK